jgi:very-short-patch-repair endonuclease
MLDPHALVHTLGGIARGSVLQRYGINRTRLARAVRDGELDRLRPGVFAAHTVNAGIRAAALHGGALTCRAALRLHGVWVLGADETLHVWVGRRGRIHPHEGCHCLSHFFHGVPVLGIVEVETALVHLYRCGGDEEFFAAFESAWHLRLLSTAARARIRSTLPAHARWLIDIARPDADSGLESLVRLRMHILGILLECQVDIAGVGRVDFVIDGRLIVEIDGSENHAGVAARHKDLRRDAAASRLGFETLRFDYAQVIHDWPRVQAAIVAAMARTSEHA